MALEPIFDAIFSLLGSDLSVSNVIFVCSVLIAIYFLFEGFFVSLGNRLEKKLAFYVSRIASKGNWYVGILIEETSEKVKEYSLIDNQEMTEIKASKERNEDDRLWAEINISGLSEEQIKEVIVNTAAFSSLNKVKKVLPEDYRDALNLVLLEKMGKNAGFDLADKVEKEVAESDIQQEYEIIKNVVNDEDKFELMKKEGIDRFIDAKSLNEFDTHKEEFSKMLREIADIKGEVKVIRVGRFTKFETIEKTIQESEDLHAIYLLSRGSWNEKLKDIESRLRQEVNCVPETERDKRSYKTWTIDGEDMPSIMVKIEVMQDWK